jgi:SAM-dependent methyltransferase
MYPWALGRDVVAPVLGPELPSVHQTRTELIEGRVRSALAAAGRDATALDLACSEGWFAHRLLEWGARRVAAVDIRPTNVRRARLVRDHFGISRERLEIREADLFRLDPAEIGSFDVVLLLGLVYHVENPMGAVRVARACARRLCVIESQLTRQHAPIDHGWGTTGSLLHADASFAAIVEHDSTANPLASAPGVLSLIPNLAALELMPQVAGFDNVDVAVPAPHHNQQYLDGDRAIVFAEASVA